MIKIALCCNDEDGDLSHLLQLRIEPDIFQIEGYEDKDDNPKIKYDDSHILTLDDNDDHIEICAELTQIWCGSILWNEYTMTTKEAAKLINFLLELNWCVTSGGVNLFDACCNGKISEKDLENLMD